MLKMLLLGGMALSAICFFIARSGINGNTSSQSYGVPDNSEFYGYPSSSSNDSFTTEPYFRIILSNQKPNNSTEISEPFNNEAGNKGVNSINLTNSNISNKTRPLDVLELNEGIDLENMNITTKVTKQVFETTTKSFNSETKIDSSTPTLFQNNNISTIFENITFESTTELESATESHIDSQGLGPYSSFSPSYESITETTNEEILPNEEGILSYLPPPSATLSLPEPTFSQTNATSENMIAIIPIKNNITQPSRLYLPPMIRK